jgi:streptogramin lyase
MTMRRLITATAGTLLLIFVAASASAAAPAAQDIMLDGATSAEGIASDGAGTFYAGDLLLGDIYRGDLRSGRATRFIDVPPGRMALGMKVDTGGHRLFVAGGATGQASVYDVRTGADIAVLNLASPSLSPFVNDVALTRDAAWFTDSARPVLYRVPILPGGSLGSPTTLAVTGPAAAINGPFNLNGIAATPNGRTLIVSHTANGALYRIDPATGSSTLIESPNLPNVDGILLEGGRLWAVQNFSNHVTELRLNQDVTEASFQRLIESSLFEVPTAVTRISGRLAFVNAKFDTGFPPAATSFDVVVLAPRQG